MGHWLRRTYNAPGLTEHPPGPTLGELTRRSRRTVRVRRYVDQTSTGLYAQHAGMNEIAGAGSDEYGNAHGSEYDLIEDGSIIEAQVLILNLCSEANVIQPKAALERKGFEVIELRDCSRLSDALDDAAELWVISDRVQHLTPSALDAIESFFYEGRGLYVWGDNDPYFVDANLILQRLFKVSMFGDSPGDGVVTLRTPGASSGMVPGHLVTTGLRNVYEGRTIAEVPATGGLNPLIYGSNGKVVTAYYDNRRCRAIIDGGFTRLYHNWESAGTDRYIVNAAAWLLNVERFC